MVQIYRVLNLLLQLSPTSTNVSFFFILEFKKTLFCNFVMVSSLILCNILFFKILPWDSEYVFWIWSGCERLLLSYWSFFPSEYQTWRFVRSLIWQDKWNTNFWAFNLSNTYKKSILLYFCKGYILVREKSPWWVPPVETPSQLVTGDFLQYLFKY